MKFKQTVLVVLLLISIIKNMNIQQAEARINRRVIRRLQREIELLKQTPPGPSIVEAHSDISALHVDEVEVYKTRIRELLFEAAAMQELHAEKIKAANDGIDHSNRLLAKYTECVAAFEAHAIIQEEGLKRFKEEFKSLCVALSERRAIIKEEMSVTGRTKRIVKM